GEPAARDALLQKLRERRDPVAQVHTPSGLDEVLAPHAAKLGIVADEVSELCALLDEVTRGEARDLLLEAANAEQLGQHLPRVIEAQGLVEVRRDQVMPQWCRFQESLLEHESLSPR